MIEEVLFCTNRVKTSVEVAALQLTAATYNIGIESS